MRASHGAALTLSLLVSAAAGASLLPPGTGGQPPDVFAGCAGCTLLAAIDSGIVSASFDGVVLNFDLVTAVYADPSNTFGAGKLDFMYQVTNEATSTDSIGRVTATDFAGFATDVGFTATGASLPGGFFANGSVVPGFVDRNTGTTVGFGFTVPLALVPPGQASMVLVIETDANTFALGEASVIDGKATTLSAFGPSQSESVPEPGTLLLLACGILALSGMRTLRSGGLARRRL